MGLAKDGMKRERAWSLVELLVVIATIGVLAGLFGPALSGVKMRVRSAVCLGNLKQWGMALHLYAAEHDDLLPPEGFGAPSLNSAGAGWYTALPRTLGIPAYGEMPWRTNSSISPGPSLFICPSNDRRATNNNLFHYCLNEHIDGTGAADRQVRLGGIHQPGQTVYLFDNGRRAAVAQQNNVHTNLHRRGAQFVFTDAHAARFQNTEYWDFSANRGRTNNPELIWAP